MIILIFISNPLPMLVTKAMNHQVYSWGGFPGGDRGAGHAGSCQRDFAQVVDVRETLPK